MYFDMMPQILLNLEQKPNSFKLVTDITTRVTPSQEVMDNVYLYETYTVGDGESAETIANKRYGDPYLYWIIFMVNEIIDPVYDWVMSYDVLYAHAIAEYGDEGIYHTHHYEDEHGNWVGEHYPNARYVTNIQYLEEENEKKREIRLIQPAYISAFIEQTRQRMAEQVL